MLRLDKAAKGNTFAKSGVESALLDAQASVLVYRSASCSAVGYATVWKWPDSCQRQYR